jgi:hypothetical protein
VLRECELKGGRDNSWCGYLGNSNIKQNNKQSKKGKIFLIWNYHNYSSQSQFIYRQWKLRI